MAGRMRLVTLGVYGALFAAIKPRAAQTKLCVEFSERRDTRLSACVTAVKNGALLFTNWSVRPSTDRGRLPNMERRTGTGTRRTTARVICDGRPQKKTAPICGGTGGCAGVA